MQPLCRHSGGGPKNALLNMFDNFDSDKSAEAVSAPADVIFRDALTKLVSMRL